MGNIRIDKILGLHVCFFFIRNLRIRIKAGRLAIKDFRERQDFHENEPIVISSRKKKLLGNTLSSTYVLFKQKENPHYEWQILSLSGNYRLCCGLWTNRS